MDNLVYLWEILVNIVETFLFFYLLKSHLKYNNHNKIPLLAGILLRVIWISFLNFNVQNTTITLMLLLLYDILFSIFLFDNSISEKTLWGSSYVIVALAADKITFWIADKFTPFPLEELIISGKIRILMSLLYLLICTIFVILLSNWRRKNLLLPRQFHFMLFFLVCFGIFASDQLLNVIIYASKKEIGAYFIERLEWISYAVLSIIFGFIFFIEYLGIVSQQNEDLRKKAVFYEMEKKHYEVMNATISTLRNWKHDYKNHLQLILELLHQNKYVELDAFVSQLEVNLVQTTRLVSTGNEILDSLLSVKMLEMKKHNIEFNYNVYITKTLSIDNITFASLLGNLLDNAIEACQSIKEKEKYINLQIKPYQEMLYINIVNSSDHYYSYNSDGNLKSTKKELGHGLGIKRIQDIANQFNGFCHIYPATDKFTVTIMLPLSDTE